MVQISRLFAVVGLSLIVFSSAIAGEKEEANKKAVTEFYDFVFNKGDIDSAVKYFGPKYIQHNPQVPDGIEGFKKAATAYRQAYPNAKAEFKKVFAENDHVILHVHIKREPTALGSAIIDIFRLENGKIVEHWDVIQPIPETMAHTNGMF